MRWVYAAGVSLAVFAGGLSALRTPRAGATGAVPIAPSAAQATPDAALPAVMVPVRIHADPPGARFSIDDGAVVDSPYDAVVPRDERPHVLRTFAEGHEESRRALSFAEPVELHVRLRALPAPMAQPVARLAVAAKSLPAATPTREAPKPVVEVPDVAKRTPAPGEAPATTPGRPRKPIDYTDPL